jgi:hypothetical integral membrane protein (TIGR02206 family)
MSSSFISSFIATQPSTFKRYGIAHASVLGCVVVASILIAIFRKRITAKVDKTIRTIATIPAIGAEIIHHVWFYVNQPDFLGNLFSLDLCHISSIFAMFLNLSRVVSRKNKSHEKIFGLLYFWSAGPVAALLFPAVEYGPEKFRFYEFFYSHCHTMLTAIYCFFVDKHKINFKSCLRAIGTLIVIASFAILINSITGENYMFLSKPPDAKTPLASFGSGTSYYLCFFLLMVAVELLMFIPVAIKNKRGNQQCLEA